MPRSRMTNYGNSGGSSGFLEWLGQALGGGAVEQVPTNEFANANFETGDLGTPPVPEFRRKQGKGFANFLSGNQGGMMANQLNAETAINNYTRESNFLNELKKIGQQHTNSLETGNARVLQDQRIPYNPKNFTTYEDSITPGLFELGRKQNNAGIQEAERRGSEAILGNVVADQNLDIANTTFADRIANALNMGKIESGRLQYELGAQPDEFNLQDILRKAHKATGRFQEKFPQGSIRDYPFGGGIFNVDQNKNIIDATPKANPSAEIDLVEAVRMYKSTDGEFGISPEEAADIQARIRGNKMPRQPLDVQDTLNYGGRTYRRSGNSYPP